MTVTSTKITAGPYIGNGIADTFSYGFGIDDKSEIRVFETDDAGTRTELTVDTDFTVNDIGESSGTVTRNAGPLPSGYKWFMRSNYKETQEVEFESQGAFYPDIHEKAFDKNTRIVQQLTESQYRSLRMNDAYDGDFDFTLPDPVSGDLLVFTETGVDRTNKTELTSNVNSRVDALTLHTDGVLRSKLDKSGGILSGPLQVVDSDNGSTAMSKSRINLLLDNALQAIAGVLPGVSEDYGFISTPATDIKDYGTLS